MEVVAIANEPLSIAGVVEIDDWFPTASGLCWGALPLILRLFRSLASDSPASSAVIPWRSDL